MDRDDLLQLDILCCPACGGDLESRAGESLVCAGCGRSFSCEDSIPRMFVPNEWDPGKADVTEAIKAFYEERPFPDYDDHDTAAALMEKARRGMFARMLDDQIPFGARILECGCGTGQLTNFLSIANRTAIGTDICLNSLSMAQRFKEQNSLRRARFIQMNLFRPCFRPGSFDLVVSNGVLHHTSDPRRGFGTIARLVKPGGYVLIGLYHRFGRLANDVRRLLFGVTGDRFWFLDRHLSDPALGAGKRQAWFMDQYRNPHESKHTLGEVIRWFEQESFTVVSSVPSASPFRSFSPAEKLFGTARASGTAAGRGVVDLSMTFNPREGGFLVVIGRRDS